MFLKRLCTFAALWLSLTINAQYALHSNPISLSLQGCDATLANQWSGTANPAGLAQLSDYSVAMAYEQRFDVDELALKSVAVVVPTKFGTVAVNGSQFGFETFRSSNYAVSYARLFGKNVAAGLKFNLIDQYQQTAGHFTAFYSDLGLVILPQKQLRLAVHCINPEQAEIHYPDYSIALPTVFELGGSWQFLPTASLMMELEQSLDDDPSVAIAMQASVKSILMLRGGFEMFSGDVSAGLGLQLHGLLVDLGMAWREPLGMISSASIGYQFK
jgi:hypothetical protein